MIQKIGIGLFLVALAIFTLIPVLDHHVLNADNLYTESDYHKKAIFEAAEENGMLGKDYASNITFIKDYKQLLKTAQRKLEEQAKTGLPEGVGEWDFKLGDWKIKDYVIKTSKQASVGPVSSNPGLFWWLSIGLGIIGGLLYILPLFKSLPGIKHNGIFQDPMTRGLSLGWRGLFLGSTIVGILIYGYSYMGNDLFWSLGTLAVILFITFMVFIVQKSAKNTPAKSAGPSVTGWLGIFSGIYLILFYILLYWAPQYLTGWMTIADPLSKMLNGGEASQWFVYGMLYTIIMLVMGIRMISKYRHNNYQMIRTASVMFFQTAFAFILPEILVRLNYPYYDFKNIWPLDYDFFFDWNLNQLMASGGMGIFMLVWGIVLIIIGVPLFTFFFGKRWYCSWVCGCGGLAETLGDPYRQLSDKSLRAWKYERWIIHGVMVFAVLMTIMVLYTYFTGSSNILFLSSDSVRTWYGFLIGSAFAGVVGTGFYPLMGNRVWCRFGCPLAGYFGLIQRFRSKFRITTNGGQCISCGNCSTYCEMGIDVRSYAQKGQNIVRASCVGCGVCAAVCPRGVLRLENGSVDIAERTTELKAIHISKEGVSILQ
ncbi:MAG: 4Fe-4S binding protein [Saprospiraceae bacterium]